jgi:hypothetical protein
MRRLAWWSSLVALVLLVDSWSAVFVRAQTDPAGAFVDRARQFIAARHGARPDSLRVLHVSESIDALSGTPIAAIKLLDTSSGRIYSLALDESTVDAMTERLARVTPAWRARRTRLDASLDAQMTGAPAAQLIPVVVWVKEGPSRRAARDSAKRSHDAVDTAPEARSIAAAIDERRAAAVTPLTDAVMRRMRLRGRTGRPHLYSPAVSADLTTADIQAVSNWPEVDRLYFDDINQPEMEVARPTLKASIVNNRGYSGTGVPIAMVEVGGRIASNPSLELFQDETSVCSTASTHSTGVAGLINSVHPTVRGVAPGALLWAGGSCTGLSSQLQGRATAAADWGARAINLSWGGSTSLIPGSNDRFFDDMVLNRHLLIVKSAGNRGGVCQGDARITSPGLAYNIVTVGGYDDRNTVAWEDDIMDECSSYVDASSTNGDREKPEVAAPSMNVNSTTLTGVGNIGSGTSWSSGLVTGVSALLIQRAPELQFWPEAIKAILMATAVHNVEGDATLSDKDGAGGVSADRADDVARQFRGNWDGVSFECDSSSTPPPIDITMPLVASRRTRAVIAWNNDPAYEWYDVQPSADLDIVVLDPQDSVVASSASLDNTYEIVDFTPGADGDYTLRITTARCDLSPRSLGWAWWRAG